MPYKCFFSYARDNTDKYLDKFYADLREEIRQHTGLLQANILFRDTGLQTGEYWDNELKDALATSEALICVVSPIYVGREFCGKEFQIFRERVDAATAPPRQLANATNVILPVLWMPVKGDMPEVLSRLQHYSDDYPPDYKTEGLRYLLMLEKETEYRRFLHLFVARVLEVTPPRTAALPPLDDVPAFEEVPSAFHVRRIPAPTPGPEQSAGGPNNVKFVFLAARGPEIQPLRRAACYGNDGGWFWRPFDPPDQVTVGTIAQQAASDENLRYQEIPLDDQIIERLRLADEKKEIIVVVVDVWSMKVPTYHDLMRLYDTAGFLNCAVIIIWNEEDDETQHNLSELRDLVTVTFRFRASLEGTTYFKGSIRSMNELRNELRNTLTDLKLKIIAVGQAEKRITGELLPAPIISVPSRDSQ